MAHIENHPYAFIDGAGGVLNVAAFAGHDSDLVAQLVEAYPTAVEAVSCCKYGPASVGQIWNGKKFTDPDYWSIVPLPEPEDIPELRPVDPALAAE